jgi:hypothetical protein
MNGRLAGGPARGPARESEDKKYNLTDPGEFKEFIEFIKREFHSNRNSNATYQSNYMNIKTNFLDESNIISKMVNNNSFGINAIRAGFAQLFYIYDNNKKQIIFIGSTSKKINSSNNGKQYKYVCRLLKRPYTRYAGTSAIYHILDNLSDEYNGICLISLGSSEKFYNKLGFRKELNNHGVEHLYLAKNQMSTLLPKVIRDTEFISQFDKIY